MSLAKLTEAEIETHLAKLPGWTYAESALTKTYAFAGFTGSIQFVNLVAIEAEALNHHPDIDIRYNKVHMLLTTHDSGGVTIHDIELAATSDDAADQID